MHPRSLPYLAIIAALFQSGCAAAPTTVHAPTGPTAPAPPSHAGAPWTSALSMNHPLVGQIIATQGGRALTVDQLAEELGGARYVLLGESHDNADHHRLQAALLRALVAAGRRPGVVMEVFDLEQQPAMDAALARVPRDADALAEASEWSQRAWGPFALHRPSVAASLDLALPLRAGNASRATLRTLADPANAAAPETLRRVCADGTLSDEARASLRDELQAAHCGALPDAMLPRMELMQRARDALMADALRRADHDATVSRGPGAPPAGAVLIAGAGHVRSDRGVPAYLRACAGNEGTPAIRSLAFIDVTSDALHPADYAAHYGATTLPFDYVWFTPRASDQDRCAAMRAPPQPGAVPAR